jgi:hypothetical protein
MLSLKSQEDVWVEKMYNSRHSEPRPYKEVIGQFHYMATLPSVCGFGLGSYGKNIRLSRETNPVRPFRSFFAVVIDLPQSIMENCFFFVSCLSLGKRRQAGINDAVRFSCAFTRPVCYAAGARVHLLQLFRQLKCGPDYEIPFLLLPSLLHDLMLSNMAVLVLYRTFQK